MKKAQSVYLIIIALFLIVAPLTRYHESGKEIIHIEICDTVKIDMWYRNCMDDPILKDMKPKERKFYAKECVRQAKAKFCEMTKCIKYKNGSIIPCDKAKKRADIKFCNQNE